MKPTRMAVQRRGPIRSPNSGTEKTAISSGVEKKIAEVSASWRYCRATKLVQVASSRQSERSTWVPR